MMEDYLLRSAFGSMAELSDCWIRLGSSDKEGMAFIARPDNTLSGHSSGS
jgi:hypothetical protein